MFFVELTEGLSGPIKIMLTKCSQFSRSAPRVARNPSVSFAPGKGAERRGWDAVRTQGGSIARIWHGGVTGTDGGRDPATGHPL